MLVYFLDFVVIAGIFAIMALSLNLEFGFAGLANFGKVAFFLVGAYTYAILSQIGIPFYLCLISGVLSSAIFGLLVSLPTLRLREDYLAITILTFGEILRMIVKAENIGGFRGMVNVSPVFPWMDSTVIYRLENVGLVSLCLFICFVIAQLLANSPYGRVMRAIREDEVAAEALGKDRAKYRAQVFMIGSAIAGVAGGLYAQYIQFISPDMFLPLVTFTVWIMVLLGGPGNNWGALLGAGLIELFDRGANMAKEYLTLPIDPSNLQYILFGVLIILVLFFRPGGILRESPIKTKALELVRKGKGVAKNKEG